VTAIDDHPAFILALETVVPLHIMRLTNTHPAIREHLREQWTDDTVVDAIASGGDVALYGTYRGKNPKRSRKPDGQAAGIFNALARAIAAAAFQPGGIIFAGTHWEVTPPTRLDWHLARRIPHWHADLGRQVITLPTRYGLLTGTGQPDRILTRAA
jgi:hypothetical protein